MTSELVPWRGHHVPVLSGEITRYTWNDVATWIRDANRYGYGYSNSLPYTTTYGNKPAEPIGNNFAGFVEGMLYRDGVVASVEGVRLRVFSQAPLLFQELNDGRGGDLFDDPSLDLLRRPWVGGTTSDLLSRALLFADFGGNAFIVNVGDELVVLRPDWVEIVLAKRMHNGYQVGWTQVGINYYEGGYQTGEPATFLRDEYAHFAPEPDPLASYRGMSWLTPIVREVQSDIGATDHGKAFWENAATPNVAVSLPKEITPQQFKDFVDKMDADHRGAINAYRTLYTAGGADVKVIGADMKQMDFTAFQGKLETRVANAGGVHPVLVGLSEGMQGSSLNAGNYQAAKRSTVDILFRRLWQNWCGSLQVLFPPPREAAKLWYDARDIPFLHEDQMDAAQIRQTNMATMASGIQAGFEPDSVVQAVVEDDPKLLKHTGLVSVQLLPPGAQDNNADGQVDGQDTQARALIEAFDIIDRAHFNPAEHPRNPKGTPGGGRFRSVAHRIADALEQWLNGDGHDDPLDGFSREQLRTTAKARGLEPRRGASAEEIKLLLLNDVRKGGGNGPDLPDAEPTPPKASPPGRARKQATSVFDLQVGDRILVEKNPGGGKWEEVPTHRIGAALVPPTELTITEISSLKDGRRGVRGTLPDGSTVLLLGSGKGFHRDERVFKLSASSPRKGTPAKAPRTMKLSTDPAVRDVQIENRIRETYRGLQKGPDSVGRDYVTLADIRDSLPDLSREEQDRILTKLALTPGVHVIPWDNYKGLTEREKAAALHIGGSDSHVIRFEDSSPRPLPSDVPDFNGDPETLRDALDLHKVDELKAMLRERGLPVSGRKRELVDRLVGSGPTGPSPSTATAPRVEGHAALAAPPHKLSELTAAGDPRADALWYRAGDNSLETSSGTVGAFEMNDQMRSRRLDPAMKARVTAIDSVMAESPLPEPILVYRGAAQLGGIKPGEAILEGRNLVGREFTDRAFVSTTTDADHASWFGGTVMRITVPKGTGAIRMADRAGTERDQQESEILLDRDLKYRITAQYGRGELEGPWGGAYVLDVEVVR